MTAYENGLKSNDTRFLLRPQFRFLQVLQQLLGQAACGGGIAEAVKQRRQAGTRAKADRFGLN